jgi:iron only hydrogenase large subunit-like protein/PAS domain-containing protein
MDQRQPVFTETAACQDCYKCVRECPVKAIRVSEGHASVVGELCVLCGHCVEVCPVGAKKVRSDVERAKALVALKPRVILSLAPSFAAEFPGIPSGAIVAAARRLGFAAVSETAFGADLVSQAAGRELLALRGAGADRPRVLLSSACPVVVDYIIKYRPDSARFLSDQASPMIAHGRWLKSVSPEGTAVVFAGPCIAKKREAEAPGGGIDAAITFKGLRTWFQAAGIDLAAMAPGPEDAFTPERASKGVLYPVDGGMIASVKQGLAQEIATGRNGIEAECLARADGQAHYVSCSGLVNVEKALDGLEDYRGETPIFLELLACEGGCVNGPRCEKRSGSVAKRLSVLEYARGSRPEAPSSALDLVERRPGRTSATVAQHGDDRIREALRLVGKHRVEDELNCAGCGYDSCRAFAAAMLEGRAERTMCVSYMRDLATKKANALVKAMPSGVVVANAELEVVECNENFAHVLGPEAEALYEAKPGLAGAKLERLLPFAELFAHVLEEDGPERIERDIRCGNRVLHGSIFVIEKGVFAGGVFQDVTDPCIQRDRIVKQARQVIDKNLRTVQRIAYLLGENAADTEAILESMIGSFTAASSATTTATPATADAARAEGGDGEGR